MMNLKTAGNELRRGLIAMTGLLILSSMAVAGVFVR